MSGQSKPIKKPHPARLRARALHYLERFATSRAHLRFVLLRRSRPEAEHHGIDLTALASWIDDLLEDFERVGYLNDQIYAEQLSDRLMARGHSPKMVRQKLRQKGLAGALIDGLFADEQGSLDRQTAITLARRKRMGPWRTVPLDQSRERKELGMFARAGFSYRTAREIIDAELDQLIEN